MRRGSACSLPSGKYSWGVASTASGVASSQSAMGSSTFPVSRMSGFKIKCTSLSSRSSTALCPLPKPRFSGSGSTVTRGSPKSVPASCRPQPSGLPLSTTYRASVGEGVCRRMLRTAAQTSS